MATASPADSQKTPTPPNEDALVTPRAESSSAGGWLERAKSMTIRSPAASNALTGLDKFKGDLGARALEAQGRFKVAYEEAGPATRKRVDAIKGRSRNAFFSQAYSISNRTEVVLNISLNQVGPLMYDVLPPNETFERRTADVWYSIEVRPWTGKATEYTQWSVTWPVLAVAAPVGIALSLVALGVSTLVASGTALATLTGIATAAAESASTAAASAGSVIAVGTKIMSLPGMGFIKTRLVDAGKRALNEPEKVRKTLVRYFVAGKVVDATAEEEERQRKKKRKKLEEVEVTGLELEKVLVCDTGKKKTDKALAKAFKKLSFKDSTFPASENPCLRVVGGPELEDRGRRQYLVFYPFRIERIANIKVEPLTPLEAPLTPEEEALREDVKVCETVEEAEKEQEKAPSYAEAKEKYLAAGEVPDPSGTGTPNTPLAEEAPKETKKKRWPPW